MIGSSVLLALVIGAAFAVLLIAIQRSRTDTRRAIHSQDVLLAANALEGSVLDLETGQRGFLLTHQAQFLLPWQQARAAVPGEGRTLLGLVSGDAGQSARARQIVADTRSYLADYSLPLVQAAEHNEPATKTVPVIAEGEARVSVIRGIFGQLLAAERTSVRARDAASRSAATAAYIGALVGIIASIALVALYAGFLTRAIVAPIRRAASVTRRLAGGDLTSRLPESGIGEIGELQRSFNQMAASLERSRDELIESRARLVVTADETRRRFERDLHDGAQQRFVTTALRLRSAQAGVPPELAKLSGELDGVADELSAAIDQLRHFAQGIHPAILAEGGLGPAMRKLARQSAVPVELEMQTNGRLPEQVEVAAYYVVSEALTNAAKHGKASRAAVTVDSGPDTLRVVIVDDGIGGAEFGRGSGLVGLKDRVEALGGTITLQSEPGTGTSLSVELPVDGGVAA